MNMMARDLGTRWVFGYGSLIWRPGFDFVSSQPALLKGAHRSLCIYSHRYRGTPERPGLVFGLERGGSCHGMGFEVDARHWGEVSAYLWEREQSGGVYRETTRLVRLADGRQVRALAFVVNEDHAQYAGRLTVEEQARLVAHSCGELGTNTEYVVNTARHLAEMGLADRRLASLTALLVRIAAL